MTAGRRIVSWISVGVLLALLAGCGSAPSRVEPASPASATPDVVVQANETAQAVAWTIEPFMDESYRAICRRGPLNVTYEGLSSLLGMRNDELDDVSVEYASGTFDLIRETLAELRRHPRDSLGPSSQLNYDVYEWWLQTKIDGEPFAFYNYDPVTAVYDRQYDIEAIWPVATEDDVAGFLSRLSQFPRYFRQMIDGLAHRESLGIMAPKFMVQDAVAAVEGLLGIEAQRPASATDIQAEAAPVFQMIAGRLGGRTWESDERREDALRRARDVTEECVIPALWELLAALDAAATRAPDVGGATALADGAAFLEYSIRKETTLPLTADDLRRVGEAEVERVLAETHAILTELGHPELANYQELMRLDEYRSRNYDLTTTEGQDTYLAAIRGLVASAVAASREVLDLWPSTEMEIHPDFDAYGNSCTPPAFDGSRPGFMTIGMGVPSVDFGRTPLVIYHEGIPGHFLQMSVAQDLDLPLVRRVERHTAYVEGWATYCETLAWELGLYEDRSPLYRLAQLEGELVRACRLVIDAGIHDRGWSHVEAGQYLERVTGLELPTYSVMDVYVGRPGWASSYTIGRLEILRLRDKARQALGERFNLTDFHHAVLSEGSVPLPILERLVDQYIARERI